MEFRVLRYFLTVAQEENMTRAAEILHTSQSNLSKQLAELEEEVGKKLFVRGKRNITLTDEGMFLRKRALEIIELTDRTKNELSAYDEEASGVVHIGAAETPTMHFLARCMKTVQHVYPKIRFDIFSGSTMEISEMLDKGLLDFAVMIAPFDMSRYGYIQLPYKEQTGLLMRKDNPLSRKKAIHPKDIQNEPLIIAHQQLEGNVISSWTGKDFSELNIVSTFNLITTPTMMIEEGMGSSFTIEDLVRTKDSGTLTFRPLNPPIEITLYLVWQKYHIFTKASEAYLKEVQNQIATIRQN